MGFDLGYIEEGTDDFIIEERFANVEGFYNMIRVLGVALPVLRQMPLPEDRKMAQVAREVFRWFDDYIHTNRKNWLEEFADYCDFTNYTADDLMKRMPPPPHRRSEIDALRADPEEFDPDLRAFFGRLILFEQPIEPDLAEKVVFLGRGLLAVLEAMAEQYQSTGDKASLEATQICDSCFRTFIDFCEAKAQEGKKVYINF